MDNKDGTRGRGWHKRRMAQEEDGTRGEKNKGLLEQEEVGTRKEKERNKRRMDQEENGSRGG